MWLLIIDLCLTFDPDVAPTFTVEPQSIYNQHVDNEINLECEINSLPPATYAWLHNGQPVTMATSSRQDVTMATNNGKSISMSTVTMVSKHRSRLRIVDVQYSDGGEYVCMATNQLLRRIRYSNTAALVLQGESL